MVGDLGANEMRSGRGRETDRCDNAGCAWIVLLAIDLLAHVVAELRAECSGKN
jgi:hypothetical protein